MAFGQQSGPPASAKQVQELLALLQEAGHRDFRDARGPMRFTQRQGAGKFTRDEATAFIDQLQEAGPDGPTPVEAGPATRGTGTRLAGTGVRGTGVRGMERLLREVPAEQLAAELARRGWVVVEP